MYLRLNAFIKCMNLRLIVYYKTTIPPDVFFLTIVSINVITDLS